MVAQRAINCSQIIVSLFFFLENAIVRFFPFFDSVINKTQLCDPFDIKLRDRFIEAIFADHNPCVRLLASLNEPVKLAQTVCDHLNLT